MLATLAAEKWGQSREVHRSVPDFSRIGGELDGLLGTLPFCRNDRGEDPVAAICDLGKDHADLDVDKHSRHFFCFEWCLVEPDCSS